MTVKRTLQPPHYPMVARWPKRTAWLRTAVKVQKMSQICIVSLYHYGRSGCQAGKKTTKPTKKPTVKNTKKPSQIVYPENTDKPEITLRPTSEVTNTHHVYVTTTPKFTVIPKIYKVKPSIASI